MSEGLPLKTKIGDALFVAFLVGLMWIWQYSKFSHGHGLFSYLGRYGFLSLVLFHVAAFFVGFRIMRRGSTHSARDDKTSLGS